MLKYFTCILLLITCTAITKAQEFGGNPPSIKWEQINTPAAKVIFPEGLDSSGLWVANIVQQMNKAILPTIGYKQKQVSILMQNQTTQANGYVQLAPFRSEFYLTPEQDSFDLGSLPWPEQLAIHEFRHVQQYNNFNVGLSHDLRLIFGEGGQAAANELAIPNWFFEGDAVFNETHVSDQGRGRLPYFLIGYRALWVDGKDYSYMKLRNGSYRDYTPDWYPLGYMLVSYGREKYGDDFWRKVTHDAASYKGGFYPFQRAVKKYSGLSFDEFRKNGLDYFKEQLAPIVVPDSLKKKYTFLDVIRVILPSYAHKHFDADYEYPAYVNDSTLVYMKSSYKKPPLFVIKTGNIERDISVRSISLDNYFAYHDGQIVYNAYRPDLRWNYRDYSELMLLDINTGKERRITKSTKYFAPSFSDDGKSIVAIKVGPSGKSEMHILQTSDGKLKTIVPNKYGLFFTYPRFYGDEHIVSAVRNNKGKMSLAVINIKTGDVRYLLSPAFQPIAFVNVKGDTVYFTATSGINDKLYALTISNDKLYELKSDGLQRYIGNYEPAVSNNKIAWESYSAYGFQIHQQNRDSIQWVATGENKVPGALPDFNISALKRDASTDLLASVDDTSLTISRYHKSYHLFNFHSIIPDFDDPNYTLSLAGENVLNTFQSNLSFTYNRDEGYKELGFDAIYGALFPYISGGVDYIFDRRTYYRGNNVYWNETNLHGGLELPFNLSEGKNNTYLAVGSDLYFSNSDFQGAYHDVFANQSYTYLNNYINFSNSIQQPKQNIYPMFGQSISLNYKDATSGISATQFLATGTFYFPGLFTNHSFFIDLAHQQKGADNSVIDFSNDFPFSRGYTAENLHTMNLVGVNYAFPIAYPDAGIANTVYFLRVRGNAFFDYTRATDVYSDGSPFKANFRSTGLEVFFDTQWFNEEAVTFGVRYSRLLDPDIFGGNGRNVIEFIVPVSIF